MKNLTHRVIASVSIGVLCLGLAACGAANVEEAAEGVEEHTEEEGSGEHGEREGSGEHDGEHREGEHGREHEERGSEGEESGERIGRSETWDKSRREPRLVLAFDAVSNSFVGTVENKSERKLCAVRVEVHLSNGAELGPTERTDLQPGAKLEVKLPADGQVFERWNAHPESSACSN